MNILQKIFTDHFEEMIYLQHPRDSVIENVEKMINCGNPAFGGANVYLSLLWNFQICSFPLSFPLLSYLRQHVLH